MELLWSFLSVILEGVGGFLVKYLLAVQGKEMEVINDPPVVYTNPDTVFDDLGIGMFHSAASEGDQSIHSDATGGAGTSNSQ